jgi:hypothetical protein
MHKCWFSTRAAGLREQAMPRIRHLAIVCMDPEKLAQFYCEVFDMSADAIRRVIGAAVVAGTLLATASLLTATVAAQAPSSGDMCNNEGKAYPPDIVIYGCTAVISAGGSNAQNLAVAFNNRGLAFRAKGDIERALAD